MDLVDEQDIALLQLGQDRGQVTGPFQSRSGGDVESDLHLGGDDPRQGGFAQAGWPGEQEVVGGLTAELGRAQDDRQVFLEFGLSHEIAEGAGT